MQILAATIYEETKKKKSKALNLIVTTYFLHQASRFH